MQEPENKKVLTLKQQRFCEEYLIDLNATQAAIRAGYSEKTASEIGAENLRKPQIQEYVSKLRQEQQERTKINADYVLNRLVDIDKMKLGDIFQDDWTLRPLSEWPDVWHQSLSSIDISEIFEGTGGERALVGLLKKIRWPDKLRNLELLGKHVTIGAFKDKQEISGSLTVTLSDLDAKL